MFVVVSIHHYDNIATFASLKTKVMITYLFALLRFEYDLLLVLKIGIGSVFNLLWLQKYGAEIGEFFTPLIFLCHSYKKWTLVAVEMCCEVHSYGINSKIYLRINLISVLMKNII